MISQVRLGMNSKTNLKFSQFLGWHLGDGCISITKKYSQYSLTGDITEELLFYKCVILPCFKIIFPRFISEIKFKKYESSSVCGIYIFDKNFVNYLQDNFGLVNGKKTDIKVPKFIQTYEQKKYFLRGLFDTDGSIYFCKSNYKTKKVSLFSIFHYKPKIKFACISEILIFEVHMFLNELGIRNRIQKPIQQRKNEFTMHSVIIDTNKGINDYLKKIGFSNPKHLTKVSIWEKFGFCPPKTTFHERNLILNEDLNILNFYNFDYNLDFIKSKLIR
ncbi:hypothetical protein C0585_03465 [Candidatus Woesearchaeota archaeon]|nr:MAG: hypothetical protein C0585_03465 [Candidatus Woesearchaeota archaeon]